MSSDTRSGQSTLITTSIYIGLIVTAAIGVVTYMGPLVDDLSDSRTIQQMLDSMTGIEETVRSVAASGEGSQQTFSLSFREGTFEVDAGDDQISYSLDTGATIIAPGTSRSIGNVKLSAGASAAVNTSSVRGTPCWQVSNSHVSACIVKLDDPYSGLGGFWQLDTGAGQIAEDTSPTGADGQLGNSPSEDDADPTWRSDCMFGGCLSFDGQNDQVRISSTAPVFDSRNMTISAWVRPSPDSSGYIMGDGHKYRIALQGDGEALFWVREQNNGVSNTISGGNLQADRWYHVVGTYDSTTGEQRLYVDGELIASATPGFVLDAGDDNQAIGNGYTTASSYFEGLIDHVSYHNHSMSTAEVQARYRTGTVRLAYRQGFDPLLRYENTDTGMAVQRPELATYVNGNISSRTGFVTTTPVERGDDLPAATVSVLMKSMTGIDYRTDITALSGSDFLMVEVQEG